MTDRLNGARAANFVSGYTAREWAQMARSAGNLKAAEAWDRADSEGWDDLHYSDARFQELQEKARQARR